MKVYTWEKNDERFVYNINDSYVNILSLFEKHFHLTSISFCQHR